METFEMFRTPIIAALTVALLGGTALAQPASAPPTNLSNSARPAPDFRDDDVNRAASPRGYADAPPADQRAYDQNLPGVAPSGQQAAAADRDIFCRRDAAARTGYTTPREAARDEQTRGTVGGLLGGAVLGTVLGAAAGNAGLGAAAGAGAGLLAGTAVGSSNARQAARDVEADYSAAYYDCMHEDSGRQSAAYDRRYYGDYDDYPPPPPPPAYYGPGPYPYYPYYYGPAYYGPSVGLSFGFGGGHGWGHRGWHGGGWRHH
ncbi:MAG: hypothetical protein U1E93_12995 [Alphaproteobacteria bacterium]